MPHYQPVVRGEGAINNRVAVASAPRQGVGCYFDRADGFARQGDKNCAYIVQPNGAVDTYHHRVQPEARVVVPTELQGEEKTNWGQVLSNVATILTSALTILLIVQPL